MVITMYSIAKSALEIYIRLNAQVKSPALTLLLKTPLRSSVLGQIYSSLTSSSSAPRHLRVLDTVASFTFQHSTLSLEDLQKPYASRLLPASTVTMAQRLTAQFTE